MSCDIFCHRYRKRDLLLVEIDESVKSSRDLLLGVYRDNPKILGEWGFEVDDSTRAAKTKAVQGLVRKWKGR